MPGIHRAHAVRYSQDSGVTCGNIRALTLWMLSYPDQARQGMEETLRGGPVMKVLIDLNA